MREWHVTRVKVVVVSSCVTLFPLPSASGSLRNEGDTCASTSCPITWVFFMLILSNSEFEIFACDGEALHELLELFLSVDCDCCIICEQEIPETHLPYSGLCLQSGDVEEFTVGSCSEIDAFGCCLKACSLLGSVTPPADGTERILKLQLKRSVAPVSLISAYAPTLTSPSEAKDRFYDELSRWYQ